jgi:nicotinamide mononucleotide transporter
MDESSLLSALLDFTVPQFLALVTGVIYVVLAAFEKPSCWVFGIISCALIAWEDFTNFRLYADGVLQIFYIAMGFVGLYQWQFAPRDTPVLPIRQWPWRNHIIATGAALLISIPLWMLLEEFTDAVYGYVDSVTTLLSLVATWMLVRKVLSNWVYWIAIDAVYAVMFLDRGGHLIALLYVIFLVVAMIGYLKWSQSHRQQHIVENESK